MDTCVVKEAKLKFYCWPGLHESNGVVFTKTSGFDTRVHWPIGRLFWLARVKVWWKQWSHKLRIPRLEVEATCKDCGATVLRRVGRSWSKTAHTYYIPHMIRELRK